jgi:surface antigen
MTVGLSNASQRVRWDRAWLFGLSLLAILGLGANGAMANAKTNEQRVSGAHHYASSHFAHHYVDATHHEYTRLTEYRHSRLHLAHEYGHSHRYVRYASYRHHRHYASAQYHHSYLQCVPYAREVSHIDLSGDAFLWWAEAAGRYARGTTPAEGAVLNFRPIRRMPLGHVAVVTSVIDSRTILVTQANWVPGTITNDVTVEDVSDNNDWSQVQVELGDGEKVGAPYPTYGFIYNQPDDDTVIANSSATGTDASGLGAPGAAQGNEVAEAPKPIAVSTDAPDRDLQ